MANGLLAKNGLIVTGSVEVQNAVTASTFSGDGSGLSGVSDFPYTGSAIISGSLEVIGNTNITGSINLQNSSTNRINFNNAAAINQPQIRLKDYATGITMRGNDVLALMSNGSGMIGMKKTATTAINFPSNAQVGFSWNTSVENYQPYLYFHRYSGNTIGIGVYGGSSTANTNGRLILQHITASGHISASTYYGDGSNLTGISSDPFPYTGSAVISGSLSLEGSGSTVFDVVGSQGQLFSITDSLSGSLFAVSDISGLPILEVLSDDTVKMGSFNNEAIIVSGNNATITGSFTGSFTGDGSNLTGIETDPFPYTGSAIISGSLEVIGTQRSSYTTASLTYSGSNITQITSSFEGGGNQITNINYTGSNVDNIVISGSDGINKIYTLSYDGSGNVTNIIVS